MTTKLFLAVTLSTVSLISCGINEKQDTSKRETVNQSDNQAVKSKQVLLSSYLQDVAVSESDLKMPSFCPIPNPIEPAVDEEPMIYSTESSAQKIPPSVMAVERQDDSLPPSNIEEVISSDNPGCRDDVVAFESTISNNKEEPKLISTCKNEIKEIEDPIKPFEPEICGVIDHRVLGLCGLESGEFVLKDLTFKDISKSKDLCIYLSCDLLLDGFEDSFFAQAEETESSPAVQIKHKKVSASWQCFQFNPSGSIDTKPIPVVSEPVGEYESGGPSQAISTEAKL